MQRIDEQFRFSASDLVGHLEYHHLTALDAGRAWLSHQTQNMGPRPADARGAGLAHEREYVETLKKSGVSVVEIAGGGINPSQVRQTLVAMRSGATFLETLGVTVSE